MVKEEGSSGGSLDRVAIISCIAVYQDVYVYVGAKYDAVRR